MATVLSDGSKADIGLTPRNVSFRPIPEVRKTEFPLGFVI
jgi:hypothetical protein